MSLARRMWNKTIHIERKNIMDKINMEIREHHYTHHIYLIMFDENKTWLRRKGFKVEDVGEGYWEISWDFGDNNNE